MKPLVFALLALFGSLAGFAQNSPTTPATTRLSGRVLDPAGRGLPGVNVFLKTTFDGATTDSAGYFAFRTRRTGTLTLVRTLVGYQLQETPLTLPVGGGALALPPVKLRESRAALADVIVSAGAFEASDERRAAALKPLDVLTTAGAMADIASTFNTLPGTTRVGEEGRLFVRGGAASETRTFLDGLPVNSPYGGAVSGMPARGRFSPTLFKGFLFSTGAYSAEYGQALSAVLGLTSLDLDPETQTGISVLSVGGSLSRTRRWERTSASVSADYTNLGPYFRLAAPDLRWAQAPENLGGSLRLAHRTGANGMLKVYGTYNRQQVLVRQPDAEAAYAADGRLSGLQNQNYYLNASYRNTLRRGWSLTSGLALGREHNAAQSEPLRLGEDETTGTARLVLLNDSARAWCNFKTGVEATTQRYDFTFQPTADLTRYAGGFTERRAAAFAESDLSLGHHLSGRVGLRGEYSGLLKAGGLAPRLALGWRPNAATQLTVASGVFFQNPTNDLLRVQSRLQMERATHYLLSYQRSVGGRTLRAEVYQKDYRELVRFDGLRPFDPTTYANSGSGYARGLDVFWHERYQLLKNIDFWVSYSLLDTRRLARADQAEAVPTFAATHNVSLVAKYWASKLKTQFSGTFSYGSPRAYDNPNAPGFNQGRTPSFQDLSLSVSHLTHLAGHYTVLHLALSNVLNRDNIFGYRYAPTADPATGQRAAVPVRALAPQMLVAAVLISINKKNPGDTSVAPD